MIKVNVRITEYAMPLTSLRLSACIFSIFLVIGIYLPFLPTWLQGRGLTAQQVGTIFAVALWARIPVGLALAFIIDGSGRRKPVLIVISLIIFWVSFPSGLSMATGRCCLAG